MDRSGGAASLRVRPGEGRGAKSGNDMLVVIVSRLVIAFGERQSYIRSFNFNTHSFFYLDYHCIYFTDNYYFSTLMGLASIICNGALYEALMAQSFKTCGRRSTLVLRISERL